MNITIAKIALITAVAVAVNFTHAYMKSGDYAREFDRSFCQAVFAIVIVASCWLAGSLGE